MKYEQPEIVVVGTALAAVQSGHKDSLINVEPNFSPTQTAAYEADE